ncbi:hypothetical protein ACIQ7Q_06955 [Streptomyces sp. NPDC096176]|uniref:hypothetical protein n=1 Tax=Streptomyces sp. NPDC096176 TaxID=3366079 RepID=UPI00380C793F
MRLEAPSTCIGQVAISDTAADRHSVHTLYDRRDDTGLRLDNSRGNGCTVYSGTNEINHVRKVTACVNIQLRPDSCGADDRPGDDH